MGQINKQICDSLLEEDCEYNGELLRRFKKGEIDGPTVCESQCRLRAPNCKYWIYHNRENLCILKRDGRKTCNGWGGPKVPSYDNCQNQTMSRYAL